MMMNDSLAWSRKIFRYNYSGSDLQPAPPPPLPNPFPFPRTLALGSGPLNQRWDYSRVPILADQPAADAEGKPEPGVKLGQVFSLKSLIIV